MPGDWIKMRTDLGEDPRVYAIGDRLKLKDRDTVVGKLHRFWSWMDGYTLDGIVTGVSPAALDEMMRCSGFAGALAEVGWLVIEGGAEGVPWKLSIPRFGEHNSETAKQRALTAQRVGRYRGKHGPKGPNGNGGGNGGHGKKGTSGNDEGHGDVTGEKREANDRVTAAALRTALPQRKLDRDREEDLRVEYSESSREGSGTSACNADSTRDRLSKPSTFDQALYARILELTGEPDDRSRKVTYGHYIARLGREGIEFALSATKDRKLDHRRPVLKSVGAYFNEVCQDEARTRGIDLKRREAA